jgi:hypothetical protein
MRIKSELLVSLGKKNPVKALQLIEELQLRHRNQYNDQIKKLAEALADEDPSLLDVLLAATNSPKTKEMIELIKFQRVLEWDPEAAAYLLRDLPESYSKQDKMAAMSRHFLKSDPQKSVEIFSQLLAQSSRGLQRGTDIISEHNYSTYYKTSPPQMLLEDFIITQPETLINATLPREGDSTRTHLNLPQFKKSRQTSGSPFFKGRQPRSRLRATRTSQGHFLRHGERRLPTLCTSFPC